MSSATIKLDVLAFAAHPDDAELGCAGTLIRMQRQGAKVGVADMTRGELGTRGSIEIREREAAEAAKVLGLSVRVNLGLRDGFFENNEASQLEVIRVIRRYQPEIVLTNAPYDRHPDHGRAAALVRDAAFLSGLQRIETIDGGVPQKAWRPKKVWNYIQDQMIVPDFVVDITDFLDGKMKAIKAFSSQFHNPGGEEPETYISSRYYLEHVEARAREMGHLVGVRHGEGFLSGKPLRVDDLLAHL